jgi:hypothetical protein
MVRWTRITAEDRAFERVVVWARMWLLFVGAKTLRTVYFGDGCDNNVHPERRARLPSYLHQRIYLCFESIEIFRILYNCFVLVQDGMGW